MARTPDPNLRMQLLLAAEAEFAQQGVEATRIDDIVRRAGRSKGSFYQHFATKEDAFRQIVESILWQLERIITTQLVDEKSLPTLEQFLARWRARDEAIFDFVWANRQMVRMIFGAGYHVGFAAYTDEFAKRTAAVVASGMEWGRAQKMYRRDLDIKVISAAISGAYDRLARDVVDSAERPNLRKWVADLQRFILHGIGDRDRVSDGAHEREGAAREHATRERSENGSREPRARERKPAGHGRRADSA